VGGGAETESVQADVTAAVEAARAGAEAVGEAVTAQLTQRIDDFNGDIRDVLRAADSRRQLESQVSVALVPHCRLATTHGPVLTPC
jgi:hypothetical protein